MLSLADVNVDAGDHREGGGEPPLKVGLAPGLLSPHRELSSPPSVTRKHDIKQFRQACNEAGLTIYERYEASQALHAYKESSGAREDMSYRELLIWLREWREPWRPS